MDATVPEKKSKLIIDFQTSMSDIAPDSEIFQSK